jgi:hypothetical protein
MKLQIGGCESLSGIKIISVYITNNDTYGHGIDIEHRNITYYIDDNTKYIKKLYY